jgi:hypothetical protein
MRKNLKELKALNKKYNVSITTDNNIPDLSNDSFILAKKERAEKFIAEHGLPESSKKPKVKGLRLKAKN